jgi:hypothetical protein
MDNKEITRRADVVASSVLHKKARIRRACSHSQPQ